MAVIKDHTEIAQYLQECSIIPYIYVAIDVIERAQLWNLDSAEV